MRVKCIDNKHLENWLTLGKEYEVISSLKRFLVMKTDTEEKITCSKLRFRRVR